MNIKNTFFSLQEDILLLDIGSGTQDVLLAQKNQNHENWVRFVIPSPAKLIAQKIRAITQEGKALILTGSNMGGGFTFAVKEHLNQGFSVLMSENAAFALSDNIEKVKAMGIELKDEEELLVLAQNQDYAHLVLADFDPLFWENYLKIIGLELPKKIAIAAQDHGNHPNMSNRIGRFNLWRDALKQNSDPKTWVFRDVPPAYTRLKSIKNTEFVDIVADTGTAALLGALSMPEIQKRSEREGVLIVNVGNSHVVAFLVYQQKVCGIYEHHTGMHSTESLEKDLKEFRLGWLPDEVVRESGGHGCVFLDIPAEAEGFRPTYILGPRREILAGCGQFIAPQGDMMLAGAFGLLYSYQK